MQKIEEFTSNIDNVGRMIDNKYLIFNEDLYGCPDYPEPQE